MDFCKNITGLLFSGLLLFSGCGATTTTSESVVTIPESTVTTMTDYNYSIDVPADWKKSNRDTGSESVDYDVNILEIKKNKITLVFSSEHDTYNNAPDAAELKYYNQEHLREDFKTDRTATVESEGSTTIGGESAYYVTWSWGSEKQFKTTRINTFHVNRYYVIQIDYDINSDQADLDALQIMLNSVKFF